MKARIISEGTGDKTFIEDFETGQRLDHVTEVAFDPIRSGHIVTVALKMRARFAIVAKLRAAEVDVTELDRLAASEARAEKAVEEARKARTEYDRHRALDNLLAALDAERGGAGAKAAELERGLAAVMGQRDQHEVEAKNACEKIGVLQRVLGEECEAKREAERLLLVHTSSAVKYQAALVEAEAALRYYSNSEIYEETTTTHGLVPACGPPIVIEDGGEVARRYFARRDKLEVPE